MEKCTFPLLPLFHSSTFAVHFPALAIIQSSRRSAVLKPTAVNSILAEMREVQARGRTVVSLMRGEPDFDTPAHIVDAAAAAMKSGRTRYPDNRGEKRLRDAIAAKLARDNGLVYDPDSEILVTTGATLGIHAALTALLDQGDEVLLPDPIYDAYQSPIRLCGGRIRSVRSAIEGGRFGGRGRRDARAPHANSRPRQRYQREKEQAFALVRCRHPMMIPMPPTGLKSSRRPAEHISA